MLYHLLCINCQQESSWYHIFLSKKDYYEGKKLGVAFICPIDGKGLVVVGQDHEEVGFKRKKKDWKTKILLEYYVKFNHFNDLYFGHKESNNNPDQGKQICDELCEEVYDLQDLEKWFSKKLTVAFEEGKKYSSLQKKKKVYYYQELFSILTDYGDFFLKDYPNQANTKSIHPTIERILDLFKVPKYEK